eukprot:2717366-Rhodomonas_salina.1
MEEKEDEVREEWMGGGGERGGERGGEGHRFHIKVVSCYAYAVRCPVLSERMLLRVCYAVSVCCYAALGASERRSAGSVPLCHIRYSATVSCYAAPMPCPVPTQPTSDAPLIAMSGTAVLLQASMLRVCAVQCSTALGRAPTRSLGAVRSQRRREAGRERRRRGRERESGRESASVSKSRRIRCFTPKQVAVSLRPPYAISGTDLAYCVIALRPPYAIPACRLLTRLPTDHVGGRQPGEPAGRGNGVEAAQVQDHAVHGRQRGSAPALLKHCDTVMFRNKPPTRV